MTTNLRIALIIITLIYITLIMKAIKNKRVQTSLCTFWIISGILLIISLIIPNFIEILTEVLGFEVPANMIFCITIFVAFYLIFNITIKLSKVYQDNIHLVQEISKLKYKLSKLENEENNKDRGIYEENNK